MGVEIYDTPDDYFKVKGLPNDGSNDNTEAFNYCESDTATFFASNIDAESINRTITHDLLVHKGLGLFKKNNL